MTPDVLGTAALRRAVLEAWRSSPTRLREDANTEEDHAHGSYRGRVVVELAQNAADAAARAGVPGRLSLALRAPSGPGDRWVLRAANTGAPLDAAGVASLAAMRASATASEAAPDRDRVHGPGGTPVGRFGVGFAALRSVADDVRIGAGEAAVGFSLARTRAALDDAVGDVPALAAEVARRGDRLPVLRLPFPATVDVPDGYDTVVEAELRDDAAAAAVRAELDQVGDTLLLALPALAEVVVDGGTGADTGAVRRVADVAERWTVVRREGRLDPDVLADRPVEERGRDRWSVVWALPRPGTGPVPDDDDRRGAADLHVVHAPTPTDEPSTFPALLLASFALEPSRRHVVPGPLTEHVARRAGEAYAELLATVAPARGVEVLDLVPTGLPGGTVDALVRDAAVDVLRRTPLLPVPEAVADAPARLVRPDQARVLVGDVGADPRVRDALGAPDLVVVPRRLLAFARSLGVELLELADVVDALPVGGAAAHWHELYAALAPHAADRGVLEALAAVPVPLADGRTARGARSLLLLDGLPTAEGRTGAPALTADDGAALGLRVVDPEAVHPLLERLGARRADLRAVVEDPAVRERVLAAAEAAEAAGTAGGDGGSADGRSERSTVESLLALVAAAVADGLDEAPFWWGELPLPTADGDRSPARSLAVPGSWAARVLDVDLVEPAVADRWGDAVLRAVGVAVGLSVLRVPDVLTPQPGEEPDLDPHGPEGWLSDWSGYLEHLAGALGPGVHVGDVAAVPDLDAVADDVWPEVLAALAVDPATRAALLEPVRAPASTRAAVSYTAWWLREELGGPFALGDVPVLRPAPAEVDGLDDAVMVALGGVHDLADLAADEWPDLLDRLPETGRAFPAEHAVALWRALAVLASRGEVLDPAPDRVPALGRGSAAVVVADAEDAVVAADPMWTPLRPVVPAPAGIVEDVAELLDLAMAPEPQAPDGSGETRAAPAAARRVVPGLPGTWWFHDALRVDGVPVPWWVVGTGEEARVHATDDRSLGEALAAAAGRYALRHVLSEVLRDPDAAEVTVARAVWDDAG